MATRCFQVLASAGHTEAQYRVACCYDQGLGVEQDTSVAVKYFMLAAVQVGAACSAASAHVLTRVVHIRTTLMRKRAWAPATTTARASSGTLPRLFSGSRRVGRRKQAVLLLVLIDLCSASANKNTEAMYLLAGCYALAEGTAA